MLPFLLVARVITHSSDHGVGFPDPIIIPVHRGLPTQLSMWRLAEAQNDSPFRELRFSLLEGLQYQLGSLFVSFQELYGLETVQLVRNEHRQASLAVRSHFPNLAEDTQLVSPTAKLSFQPFMLYSIFSAHHPEPDRPLQRLEAVPLRSLGSGRVATQ